MVMNGIILAISGRDTLRPLGILFRPWANSVRDTKYNKRCSEDKHLEDIKWAQGSSFSVAHR